MQETIMSRKFGKLICEYNLDGQTAKAKEFMFCFVSNLEQAKIPEDREMVVAEVGAAVIHTIFN